jgi:hypothetical protein
LRTDPTPQPGDESRLGETRVPDSTLAERRDELDEQRAIGVTMSDFIRGFYSVPGAHDAIREDATMPANVDEFMASAVDRGKVVHAERLRRLHYGIAIGTARAISARRAASLRLRTGTRPTRTSRSSRRRRPNRGKAASRSPGRQPSEPEPPEPRSAPSDDVVNILVLRGLGDRVGGLS